ncbi:hypothetical protein F4560_000992 [Saccharothrix ecbatanensis]|uniref:Uncharacterized protein n=1 Tax=Saccharothrix ecbatanensis TaxID=1105145 RepID=A0A7W9LYU5_9PSEU|nr:hypothetical protein [Saccharothrix ecbatanensis]MBB5801224.1 hypothetical protein [Saccharothrix ecbatanensis]
MAELTLVLETADGTFVRRIPDASPLPAVDDQGYEAEDASRNAASTFGMPDFMFLPKQQRNGSGMRELGDGTVVVGPRAAVLQVKSRVAPSGDAAKESAWLTKNISKAYGQASGTVRRLTNTPAVLTNARGRSIHVAGAAHQWLSIVIVDHPDVPEGYRPPPGPGNTPAVVLMRRDWEFLFNHLYSTRAVLVYLHRVAGEPLELGGEPLRYHEFALADREVEPDPVAPKLAGFGTAVSTARAPLSPAGRDDMAAHLLLRVIMEDIARTPLVEEREADRIKVLADIDGFPIDARTELGRTLLGFMSAIGSWTGEGVRTETRLVAPNPDEFTPMVFMVASQLEEHVRGVFHGRVHLFHYDLHGSEAADGQGVVGVLLTPSRHPEWLWDTTMFAVDGLQGYEPADMEEIRAVFAQHAP